MLSCLPQVPKPGCQMAFVCPSSGSCVRLQNRSFSSARLVVCRATTFSGVALRRRVRLAFVLAAPSMNISSNDFRPGTTIEVDGIVFRVQESLHVKPGKGSAFVRTKLKNMKSGNTMEKTFKAGEMVPSAQLEKIEMQHTYMDGDDYVFMNMETYDEERINSAILGDNIVNYMMEGLTVEVLKHNLDILGCEIPKSMTLTVAQTDPGVKGNTVQGGTKPATLESGAIIQVPLFINEGEKIIVNTEKGEYVGRDNT